MAPYYPSEDGEGIPYTINTLEERAVAEYTGIPLFQVYELDVFTFWALLRDVVIYNRSRTKSGREWLKNAHRLTQTKPDLPKLRRKAGKGGSHGGKNN